MDFEESALEDSIKPCALCSKSFSNNDVIMASRGCHYHPWCVLFQNWNSKSCVDEACNKQFKEAWQKSLGIYSQ